MLSALSGRQVQSYPSDVDFETRTKLQIYGIIAETGRVPDVAETAAAMKESSAAVQQAFEQLRAKRLLVLEPDDSTRIRMAPPFSGVATSFLVFAQGRNFYANCVWDAYGVAAALHSDSVIDACDGHTGEAMRLEVRGGGPVACQGVAHFAVPAAKWWQDIVFT